MVLPSRRRRDFHLPLSKKYAGKYRSLLSFDFDDSNDSDSSFMNDSSEIHLGKQAMPVRIQTENNVSVGQSKNLVAVSQCSSDGEEAEKSVNRSRRIDEIMIHRVIQKQALMSSLEKNTSLMMPSKCLIILLNVSWLETVIM